MTASFSLAALARNWLTENPSFAASSSLLFFTDSGNCTVRVLMFSFLSALGNHGAKGRSRQAAPSRENPSRYASQYSGKPRQKPAPTPCRHQGRQEMAATRNEFPANALGWQDSAESAERPRHCRRAAGFPPASALAATRYRDPQTGRVEIPGWEWT